jgi:hypothetical protein
VDEEKEKLKKIHKKFYKNILGNLKEELFETIEKDKFME